MTTSASAATSTAGRPAAVCPRCLGQLIRPGQPPRFLGDGPARTVICADCCTDRTVRAVLGLAPVLRTEWPLPSLLSWPSSVDLAVLDVADVHGRPSRVELSDWSLHGASWGRDGVLQMTLHGAVHSVDRLPDGLVYLVIWGAQEL
ncbi:hypothetical protein ACIG5E_34245 [Kitasatospora sp. NPDC053057]|uniref:hypothetical protein n=1 Tax=Kitasatospora sp. NPDC053057 TaxID=3364062 RepID=UPI0037C82C0C